MTQVKWTQSQYDYIVKLLNVRTGLAFRPDQRNSAEAGIQRAMERSHASDLDEFVEILMEDNPR